MSGAAQRAMLKFALALDSTVQAVRMPPGAVIRYCDHQDGGVLCMWAECPSMGAWDKDTGPVHERKFQVVPTGQAFMDGASYIGSVPTQGPWGNHAGFVWHITEVTK